MYSLRSDKLESSESSESEEDLTIPGEGSQRKLTTFFTAASALPAPQAHMITLSKDGSAFDGSAGGQGEEGGRGVGFGGGKGSPLRAGSFGLTPSQRA
jgi:hypothetical protein